MFNKRLFKSYVVLAGMTQKDVAENLGISEPTLYRKMKNDGSFLRSEIESIMDMLMITDPVPVFFASNLTDMQDG